MMLLAKRSLEQMGKGAVANIVQECCGDNRAAGFIEIKAVGQIRIIFYAIEDSLSKKSHSH